MARDPALNTHFLNYVSACLRQGVSPKTLREALLAMGDLSDRTVDTFLNRPELRALSQAPDCGSEATSRVDSSDLPPLELSSSVTPTDDLLRESRRLLEATRSEIGLDLSAPGGRLPVPRSSVESVPGIELETPHGSPHAFSRQAMTAAAAALEIENPDRPLAAAGRDTFFGRMRRRARGIGFFFARLHRRTVGFLESVVAYSALALLLGLLAMQIIDRVDPLLLTGVHPVDPTSAATRTIASPPGTVAPVKPIRTVLHDEP